MIILCVCETRNHVSLFHKICLYVLKTDIEEHVKQLLLKLETSLFKSFSLRLFLHLAIKDCFELRCFFYSLSMYPLCCQRASPGGHRASGRPHRHTIVDELKSSSHAAYQIPSTTYLRMLHLPVILANP